jgi:hypothetical protein
MTFDYVSSRTSDDTELYGKVQAYAHHRQQNTPVGERPNISLNMLKRARDKAHEYILSALRHLAKYDPDEFSDGDLKSAAQILEEYYLTAPLDTPSRTEELYTAALAYYLSGHYPRAFVLM